MFEEGLNYTQFEQLKEFLKDNLRAHVSVNTEYGEDSKYHKIKVTLSLCDQVISESYDFT